ncbi:VOC family protein [Aliidiomarina sp. Khilg15.8]
MKKRGAIDYVEFPAQDMNATKAFFTQVFEWTFSDYGEDYSCFHGAGLEGGIYKSAMTVNADNGSPLLVFYDEDLDTAMARVEQAGGNIKRPAYAFPGGKRFHFTDPSGNEYAVWSDKDE